MGHLPARAASAEPAAAVEAHAAAVSLCVCYDLQEQQSAVQMACFTLDNEASPNTIATSIHASMQAGLCTLFCQCAYVTALLFSLPF